MFDWFALGPDDRFYFFKEHEDYMASLGMLVTEFVKDRKLTGSSVVRLADGRLVLDTDSARAVCGAVRLMELETRLELLTAARKFNDREAQSVLHGLHMDAAWGAGMLDHVVGEAALTLLVMAEVGVIKA